MEKHAQFGGFQGDIACAGIALKLYAVLGSKSSLSGNDAVQIGVFMVFPQDRLPGSGMFCHINVSGHLLGHTVLEHDGDGIQGIFPFLLDGMGLPHSRQQIPEILRVFVQQLPAGGFLQHSRPEPSSLVHAAETENQHDEKQGGKQQAACQGIGREEQIRFSGADEVNQAEQQAHACHKGRRAAVAEMMEGPVQAEAQKQVQQQRARRRNHAAHNPRGAQRQGSQKLGQEHLRVYQAAGAQQKHEKLLQDIIAMYGKRGGEKQQRACPAGQKLSQGRIFYQAA